MKCIDRRWGAKRGFTLIEVLVALAIVAIALVAALRAVGSLALATDSAHERLLAEWSAQNRLAQVHLARAWPDVGERSYGCNQGDLELQCTETVSNTPNPIFRRLEVRVRDAHTPDTVLALLITLVANESARSL